jgi:hypothetical protein
MIGLGIGVAWNNNNNKSSGNNFDADYQAVLNYATTQGYTPPSAPQQIIQNQLVIDLKAGGIWSKLDTFANFATDGSSDFALIDWKRLSLYTAVNSPTFTINEGFTGDGTSSYIDTNFNAFNDGAQYTQDDASRFIYMFNASGTAALDGKAAAGINNMARTSTSFQRINTTSGLTGGSFSFDAVRGMKSIHRTSSTTVELFNDTTQASRTATSATLNNNNQLILRSGASYGGHTISMCANGTSLVAENTAFVNAFNTYLYDINNLDSDYVAVLDRAITLGYTLPTFSQIIKQNQLVIDLKDAGVWDKLDTFAVFATDGSSDFALIDWKRLTQYTAVNSPTFTINQGFKGNGTSSYIDTNFTPSTDGVNYQLDNASRYFYGFDGGIGQRFEGNLDGVNNMRYGIGVGYSNLKINSGADNLMSSSFGYTPDTSMKSIHRTSATDIVLYNAEVGDSRTLTSVDLPTSNQTLFRVATNYVAVGSKMYAMGSSLVTENTDFVTAFDTYLNSL